MTSNKYPYGKAKWRTQVMTAKTLQKLIDNYRGFMSFQMGGHWQSGTIQNDSIEVGQGTRAVLTAKKLPNGNWKVKSAFFSK